MIKVQCCSGYAVNEKPMAFSLHHSTYQVKEIIDRWYGEDSVYFKVTADDDNIYLLKYDKYQDEWDLVFYKNPKKVDVLMPEETLYGPFSLARETEWSSKRPIAMN
jgi:hypothetical protein|tara:strand:+ start:1278 stop:1595 length:318 start_codon:yes stop_codon:yes gene_type:complete